MSGRRADPSQAERSRVAGMSCPGGSRGVADGACAGLIVTMDDAERDLPPLVEEEGTLSTLRACWRCLSSMGFRRSLPDRVSPTSDAGGGRDVDTAHNAGGPGLDRSA